MQPARISLKFDAQMTARCFMFFRSPLRNLCRSFIPRTTFPFNLTNSAESCVGRVILFSGGKPERLAHWRETRAKFSTLAQAPECYFVCWHASAAAVKIFGLMIFPKKSQRLSPKKDFKRWLVQPNRSKHRNAFA